ncbi:unnamed protein product, partial [Staurois parvus]
RAPDPQAERQVSGPQRSGGRRTPRRSDRSRTLRAEWWVPDPQAERQVSGPQAGRGGGTESPGTTRAPRHLARQWGSESTGMTAGTGSDHWIVWLDSGHWVTRHQVIWLDSGHRVIWQGSGSESTGTTVSTGSSGTGLSG